MLFEEEKLDLDSEEENEPEAPKKEEVERVDPRFLAEKDRALKEERKRRKEAEAELDKLRQASAQPPVDPAKIAEQVKADIQLENYTRTVNEHVGRLTNLTEDEVKQLREQISLLPKSGNPVLDVDFALERMRRLAMAESQSSPLPPISVGTGGTNFSPITSKNTNITPLAKEYGQDIGKRAGVSLDDKDYERFTGGPLIK